MSPQNTLGGHCRCCSGIGVKLAAGDCNTDRPIGVAETCSNIVAGPGGRVGSILTKGILNLAMEATEVAWQEVPDGVADAAHLAHGHAAGNAGEHLERVRSAYPNRSERRVEDAVEERGRVVKARTDLAPSTCHAQIRQALKVEGRRLRRALTDVVVQCALQVEAGGQAAAQILGAPKTQTTGRETAAGYAGIVSAGAGDAVNASIDDAVNYQRRLSHRSTGSNQHRQSHQKVSHFQVFRI
ncbi:hypothetical protein D3C87_1451060 [compost metagenome]